MGVVFKTASPFDTPLSIELLKIVRERGRLTMRDAVTLSGANRNTIKLHIRNLVHRKLLYQEGMGKATWYRAR